MSDLLNNGVEKLSDILRVCSNTKTAFKSIVDTMEEISEFVKEHNKGMVGSLRESYVPPLAEKNIQRSLGTALSSSTRSEELREKFRRAKTGLNDSITYGLWELAVDDRELLVHSSIHRL